MEETANSRNGALATLARQGAMLRRNLRKPVSIESRRIAFERMITLEFPHFKGFFAEYSSNISMNGMFIRTDRIQPPGTLVAFEFNLADGLSLISGQAEVIWVREQPESSDRPAGLGLRFVRLDKESRRLIRWAVEKQIQKGGRPFDLDEAAMEPKPAGIDGDASSISVADADLVRPGAVDETGVRLPSYAGVGVARSWLDRWRWAVVAALAALVAGAMVYMFYGRARGGPEATGPVASPPAAVEVAPQIETATPADTRRAEILDMAEAWAEAWAGQRVETYLSFYSEAYRPAEDLSLEQWRRRRRERVSGPARIDVGITELEVQLLSSERSRVSFVQTYASDRYRDRTRKILDLVLEQGRWKILRERTES